MTNTSTTPSAATAVATTPAPLATPVKIIHVGLGGWGGDWAVNAIPPVDEVEVVAVVDIDAATRTTVAEQIGLPASDAYGSLAEALAGSGADADAVVITAPAVTHVPLALEALEAGMHVLVEKPFANSTAEAATAVTRARELGLVLQVSQNYRWYPAPRKVAELLAAKTLGEIATIDIDFRQWDNDQPAGSYRHYAFPHPLIMDMAIHHMDLLRMVTGREAVRVYARDSYPSFSHYAEEAVTSMIVELDDGTVVSYRGSWLHRGPRTAWAGDWRISGEQGELTFTSRGDQGTDLDRVALRGPAAPGEVGTGTSRVDGDAVEVPLAAQELHDRSAGLQAFAYSVAGGPAPETSGLDNLRSLAIVEAALRSAASGLPEEVQVPAT